MPEESTDSARLVELSQQPVELYKVLKFEGLVNSGAEAKMVIDDGLVVVNGQPELRRRRKIRENDLIEFDGVLLKMVLNVDVK